MPTFLKSCPRCGKRFEVERVGETVTKEDAARPEDKSAVELSRSGVTSGPPAVTSVDLGKVGFAEVFEEDEYTETFECRHCGNTWTETREKLRDLGRVDASEGDIG